MNSMTGFGKGSFNLAGKQHSVELRSLNHRFLDVHVRLPWFSAELESRILERVRASLARGRVDVVVSEEHGAERDEQLSLNEPLARELGQMAAELASLAGVSKEAALALLPHRQDLVSVIQAGAAGDPAVDWEAVAPGLDSALEELVQMRTTEGEAHQQALAGHRGELIRLEQEISALAGQEPQRLSDRLNRRLTQLTGDLEGEGGIQIDPVRLAQEAALLAHRADVTEELDRLRSHFAQLGNLLEVRGEALGRKLEFLQQELLREFNTTGSKTQNPLISHLVVEAKSVLEKMRELVQNVE